MQSQPLFFVGNSNQKIELLEEVHEQASNSLFSNNYFGGHQTVKFLIQPHPRNLGVPPPAEAAASILKLG